MLDKSPLACVLGDMDLIRPLGLAGIKCAVAVPPGASSRYSRFTTTTLEWANPWEDPEKLVEILIKFGKSQPERPVLFYESDAELLLVSRHRKTLQQYFRFIVPDPDLVEALVDKELFKNLADDLALPVPRSCRLWPRKTLKPPTLDLRYPIIVKPLTRRPETWKTVVQAGKAVRIENPEQLSRMWPRLVDSDVDVLAQESIHGPESRIESYHVYVSTTGEIVAEFTGRKLRTYPLEYGDSCALLTTDVEDVAVLGRELVHRLGLRGVAKFDFKRAHDGKLYLLEVNPRFNLWHHLGALAGVNIPALVYEELIGKPRLPIVAASSGLSWCRIWQDALAARQSKLPLVRWLIWALRCDAKRLLAWDDPLPFLGGVLWRVMDHLRPREIEPTPFSFEQGGRSVTTDAA